MRRVLLSLLTYVWAAPNTMLALPLVSLAWMQNPGSVRLVEGVVEVHGGTVTRILSSGWLPFIGSAAAMTIGHVVIGTSQRELNRTRLHERVHVRQYERWGPFFLPAYFASSLWCWLRGKNPYLDNVFEREAYGVAGA